MAVSGRFPQRKTLLLGIALFGFATRAWTQDSTVVAWGDNRTGQATVPSDLRNVVAIAAGEWHNLALKADGTVIAWGYNAGVPWDLGNVVAVAAGGYHNLALKADSTVRAWGENGVGQSTVPAGLSNVVAISGGWQTSLALKADGTVVAWGDNRTGQIDVPSGLRNVVAIAAAEYHNLALKSDGTVTGWGWNGDGQITIPAGLSNNVVAIAAGGLHSLALKADGTVAAWGWNRHGQATVPAGLRNVVAIRAGAEHSLALKSDGTVVGWGANDAWASNDPSCAYTQENPCPRVTTGQTNPPAGLNNVVAIAAGNFHSLALKVENTAQAPSAPVLSIGAVANTSVTLTWSDLANESGYRLEARVGANGNWTEIATPGANATSYQHTGIAVGTTMFYRLRSFNPSGTSPFSAEVSATTSASTPLAPTLSVTVLSPTAVDLGWNDVDRESGYKIERRTSSSEWLEIATPAANVTSFSDASLTPATTYFYRIRALSTAGNSPFSAEVQARTQRLAPPTSPTLGSTGNTHSIVTLTWSDVANESGYKLEVKNSAGAWTDLVTLDAGVTTFNHNGLTASTAYTYRISAFNAAGSSALSGELTVTTQSPQILPPLTIRVLDGDPTGIQVRISGDSGQRFKVQRTTDFRNWTDVDSSILLSTSTDMTLSGEVTGGFFRTVNTQ